MRNAIRPVEEIPKSPLIGEAIIDNIIGGKNLLTVSELADYLQVSPKTIYGWHYRGLIQAVKIGPRLIRFDTEKVMRWISKGDLIGNL